MEAVARNKGKDKGKDNGKKRNRHNKDRGKVKDKGRGKQRAQAQAEGCWRASACIPKKGANASQCNLEGYTAPTGLDCTGCNLSRANLRGATLRGVRFPKANLSGSCLVDADFTGAAFATTTNLANAVFCRTTMPDGSVNTSGCSAGTACCPTCIETGASCGTGIVGACCGAVQCINGACQSCTPATCQSLGKTCGQWQDGCGGTLACGTCGQGKTCQDGICGCPTTCQSLGKNCGATVDGCGETVQCGTCTPPQTCGGGGTANVCGCTPTTCAALDQEMCRNPDDCGNYGICGTFPDGCGGFLDCGSCSHPCIACQNNICVPRPASEVCGANTCCINQCCFNANAGICGLQTRCADGDCCPLGFTCCDGIRNGSPRSTCYNIQTYCQGHGLFCCAEGNTCCTDEPCCTTTAQCKDGRRCVDGCCSYNF